MPSPSLHAGALTATKRFALIAGKLVKYGFGSLLGQLGLNRFPWNCRRACSLAKDLSPYARLRRVIEELGPAPIKIGQLLSMRPDLVPLELCEELKGLQEDVQHESLADVRREIEQAYAAPLESLFTDFEPESVAAASLSQVHRARRKDTGALVDSILALIKNDPNKAAQSEWSGASPVGDNQPRNWMEFMTQARTLYPRFRHLRLPVWLALSGCFILEKVYQLLRRPALLTTDAVRGFNLEVAVRPNLVWKDLDLEMLYPTIREGLAEVFCRNVPFSWLPSVRDRCACYLDQGACPLPKDG